LDIHLNTEVRCTAGTGGHSTCLIINPVTKEITHLVVQTKGFIHEEYVVPLSLIAESGRESDQFIS
jgi:hypothetical protein